MKSLQSCAVPYGCVGRVFVTDRGLVRASGLWTPLAVALVLAIAPLSANANPFCGDRVIDAGEGCDDGNRIDGDGCEHNCKLPNCGDGILDPGEQCDDGNAVNADGCQITCRLPYCGDNVKDPGEACDHGNDNSDTTPNECRRDCTKPRCGDGVIDNQEQCDGGDGCTADCTVEVQTCGNGLIENGEQCDDGNTINGDGCRKDCTLEMCGDGALDIHEQCDDGNVLDGDGCRGDCMLEVCGDALLDAGEECDDGAANSDTTPDQCRTDCMLPRCGDGVHDTGEECDDENDVDGDGCSADCMTEEGGEGCTPGYWKQPHHFEAWVGYGIFQKFDRVFDVQAFGHKTLLQVLLTGGGGKIALGRHAVAALLNAVHPEVDYAYTPAEVIALVQQAFATGNYEATKNLLKEENQSGCPLGRPHHGGDGHGGGGHGGGGHGGGHGHGGHGGGNCNGRR